MKKLPLFLLLSMSPVFGQLQPEPTGVIGTLPGDCPKHWISVQDASFFHMSDGKFIVVDAESDDFAGRVKGMFNTYHCSTAIVIGTALDE